MYIPLLKYQILCFHFIVSEHWDCLWFWAYTNSTAMIILVHVLQRTYTFISLTYKLSG